MSINRQHISLLPLKGVLIECLDENGDLIPGAHASGFVVSDADGRLYLYTAWHVVTGYDPHHVKVGLSLPCRRALRVSLQQATSASGGATIIGGLQQFELALYDVPRRQGELGTPRWLQDEQDVPHAELNAVGLYVPFWHDAVKLLLPNGLTLSPTQVCTPLLSPPQATFVDIGDKALIVGFPYGFSAFGAQQPTPVVLTRFVAALHIHGRPRQLFLDGSGAPGMSGGAVFVRRADGELVLLGMYTGIVYPDHRVKRNEKTTALGTIVDLSFVWRDLPFVEASKIPAKSVFPTS